jgi:hypothetical protein
MNIPDHISEILETIFWAKNTSISSADPDPGCGILLIVDLGWKIRIRDNIPDPQNSFSD